MALIGEEEVCNRALIVSVARFCPEAELGNRYGARRDAKRLQQTLSARGFHVTLINDPDAEQMEEAFRAESQKAVDECFVGIISTHGEEGVVFGADGCPVRLAKIYSFFGGPKMAGKNKLFLIQACRGSDLDDGVEIEADSSCSSDEVGLSEYSSVPADTAVMYATAPGYSAFMNLLGSVFLQTFCDLLEEGGAEMELTRLLTRLSHRVAFNFQSKGKMYGGKKEMPCLVSRLTQEFYPFRGSRRKQRLLSATELLGAEHRSCMNSIN